MKRQADRAGPAHQEFAIPAPAARARLAARLLAWYDRHRRDLPWRAPPGAKPDPYRVWLSEIMLQQTTVATVGPYFERFVARWPTVEALAAAETDEVLHAWQGLGYYARARNMLACAKAVAAGGRGFPEDEADLRALPGVGPYTAAAIAAIAFDRPATAVDGNVERVMARLFAIDRPLPAAKPLLRAAAESLTPPRRPGDYAQAAMDLGATVCTPRRPDCGACPWRDACRARRAGIAESLPARAPRKKKPKRFGTVFWAVDGTGAVLLRRRPEKGLLGGMMEFPSTDWREAPWTDAAAVALAPVAADWSPLPATVHHVFTHFELELGLLAARFDGAPPAGMLPCPPDRFSDYALPTVMKKVAALARDWPGGG